VSREEKKRRREEGERRERENNKYGEQLPFGSTIRPT